MAVEKLKGSKTDEDIDKGGGGERDKELEESSVDC